VTVLAIHVFKSRRDGLWHACFTELRRFERTGRTKEEARDACLAAVERQAKYLYFKRYIFLDDRTVACLHYADGWQYDVMRPKEWVATRYLPSEIDQYAARALVLDQLRSESNRRSHSHNTPKKLLTADGIAL
jgi:hypothetical protein